MLSGVRIEDERPHPKVGAVIVKAGKKISEAFRNEDRGPLCQ